LVLVTLIVTRSLKLLIQSAVKRRRCTAVCKVYSYRPNKVYVYRKHARNNCTEYNNIATSTTGYDKETCLNIRENVYYHVLILMHKVLFQN